MKSMIAMISAGAVLALLAGTAAGAEVEVESGGTYCFAPGDFSQETMTGICVTGVPGEGQVLLGERVVRPGDVFTAQQVAQMTFCPGDRETNAQAEMTYLPIYQDRVDPAAVLSIQVLGKQNQPPVAEDSALETYKNLANQGKLKAEDPEGESLTYTVTRQPRRGTVTVQEDGSFTYEPKKNKVGVDSFTYTAADPAGNVSREATVTITILKPTDATLYTDTAGKDCQFAAEWMKNTGIFTGETIHGNRCFGPEKPVSQGEFLTMLVSALELSVEQMEKLEGLETASVTQNAPDWLKPYLAAAVRSGLTAGWPDGSVVDAEQPITGAEAAVMIQNALDLSMPGEVEADGNVPAWAADAVTVLGANGVALSVEPLTRGEVAQVLYRTAQLAPEAPGMIVLQRMQ